MPANSAPTSEGNPPQLPTHGGPTDQGKSTLSVRRQVSRLHTIEVAAITVAMLMAVQYRCARGIKIAH